MTPPPAAQLKVNLRPLYAAVHTTLATLTPTALGPLIWELLFAELALAASGDMADVEAAADPVWADVEMKDWDGKAEDEVIVENARTFRDPPRTRREELLSVELRRDTGALFEEIKQVRFRFLCFAPRCRPQALTLARLARPPVATAVGPRPARRAQLRDQPR